VKVHANPLTIPPADALPSIPCPPELTFVCTPKESTITLKLCENNEKSGGSAINAFRVYHSTNGEEFFLHADVPAAARTKADKNSSDSGGSTMCVKHKVEKPALGVPHWYRVTALSSFGESDCSDSVGPILLDYAPAKPAAPTVKRHGSNSVLVTFTPPPNRGESEIHRYYVEYYPISRPDEVALLPLPSKPNHVVIENLELGEQYVFAVTAENSKGKGEQSAFSEEVTLGMTWLAVLSRSFASHLELTRNQLIF
jgi:hypothetical protein